MDAEYESKLIEKYGEQVVIEGYAEFDKLGREREIALGKLRDDNTKEQIKYSFFNKNFTTKRGYDYEGHLKELNKKFDAKELKLARKYDFKEKEDALEKKREVALKFKEQKDDIEKDHSKLTKEEKLAQAKENFTEEQAINKEEAKDLKSGSVANKEKNADIKFDADINREDITKKADDKRAQIIAEIKAAQERNRQQQKERGF